MTSRQGRQSLSFCLNSGLENMQFFFWKLWKTRIENFVKISKSENTLIWMEKKFEAVFQSKVGKDEFWENKSGWRN